jgi:hypothetical protein
MLLLCPIGKNCLIAEGTSMFLLIEPNASYQQAITTALKWADARYVVAAVTDEPSAIAQIRKRRFNVILLEHTQSELFKTLKDRSPHSMFVATTDKETKVSLPVDYVLPKPPTRLEIIHCLSSVKTVKRQKTTRIESPPRPLYTETCNDDRITIQTGLLDEPDGLFGIKVNKGSSIAEVVLQLAKERCSPAKLIRAGTEITFDERTVLQHDDYLLIQ